MKFIPLNKWSTPLSNMASELGTIENNEIIFMGNDNNEFLMATHQKFSKFKELSSQLESEQAWEQMLEGFPVKQQQRMTPFIAKATLAEGFTRAIPFFRSAGMEMEVVNISNNNMGAVIEIQIFNAHILPAGVEKSLSVTC